MKKIVLTFGLLSGAILSIMMLATMPVSMPRRFAIAHMSSSVESPASPMHMNHDGAIVAATLDGRN